MTHTLTQRHRADAPTCGEELRTIVADRGMAHFEGKLRDVGYSIVHAAAQPGETITCPLCFAIDTVVKHLSPTATAALALALVEQL